MSKSTFKNHLIYYWWAYLIALIVAVCVWIYAFNAVLEPSDDAKINIAFVGKDFDKDTFSDNLLSSLKTGEKNGIKKVNVTVVSEEDKYNLSQLIWARSIDCDLMIFTESFMFNGIGDNYFTEIESNKEGLTFYEEDGKKFAIAVWEGTQSNNFKECYSGNEKCYLFFTVNGQKKHGDLERVLEWMLG